MNAVRSFQLRTYNDRNRARDRETRISFPAWGGRYFYLRYWTGSGPHLPVSTRAANLWHAIFTAVPILLLLSHQRLYTVNNMYTCTHIWQHRDCVWITVVTKQYCNETFLHKSERCEVLTGYLSLGSGFGGDWGNTWQWTERFTVFFW
jgi:hypothetical protein